MMIRHLIEFWKHFAVRIVPWVIISVDLYHAAHHECHDMTMISILLVFFFEEFTGHWWVPLTKGPVWGAIEQTEELSVIWDAMVLIWHYCNACFIFHSTTWPMQCGELWRMCQRQWQTVRCVHQGLHATKWRQELRAGRTGGTTTTRQRYVHICAWWRHQMETFSVLLANSPHKGQWHGALMFSLICAWTNGWVNNRDAGDLRRHCAHYDVTVMA